jgi:hypothetical protein
MLLPSQRTTLVQTGAALDFGRRSDPGLLMLGGEESTQS